MAKGPAFLLGSLVALLALRPLSAVHSVHAIGSLATAEEERRMAAWQRIEIESTTHVDLGTYKGPTNVTGIVTHAGHHALDYIDSATMLGLVLQRYLPDVPRFAIVIEGMEDRFQDQLKNAGWHLIMVEDWGEEHIGGSATSKFFGRWGDSFEKLNVWRFPLDRVLFLDSDTYVFSNKVREILDTKLEPGQIAMTKDGCKPEHNSGMMLFKPELSVYDDLLRMIAQEKNGGREILDQTLVNKRYEGKIVTMDSKFNCIDYQVDPRCKLSCGQDTVIAHFTGNPKPTREGVPHVNLVRHGNTSVCLGNNLGGCQLWSRYYCYMKENTDYLSKLLKRTLSQTGPCLSDVALAEEKLEADAKAVQEQAERKAKEEADRKAMEAADRKAKEAAEAKANEEADRKAKEAAAATASEEFWAKARQEEADRETKWAKLRQEEADRKAKEEAEAKAKEDAEAMARQEEAERKVQDEAEAKVRREDADRRATEEAEARAKAEAEEKAREEAQAKNRARRRQRRAEAKAKEEAEAKAKEEAEAKAKEAAEAKVKAEAEAKARQEEADGKFLEDLDSEAKVRQEEAERKAKEQAEAKALQEESERKAREGTHRDAALLSTREDPVSTLPRGRISLVDTRKKLEDAISTLPKIQEVALAREALQKQVDEITKKQLEDSISALPDIPEVASARRALQDQLDDVNARIR